VARLLQAAEIDPTDVALDIACATGYDAAVLGRLCLSVVAIDEAQELVAHATRTLGELDIDNVAVIEGELPKGYPEQGPYDVIYFGGAVARVPQLILDQLADPGRLLAVITDGRGMGRASIFLKRDGIVSKRVLFDAGTPMLPGFAEETPFVF
ncbi:MAG: protein-L-isoaspartate O-methyltransferase, partial [Alphaproteobacteria bacterium]